MGDPFPNGFAGKATRRRPRPDTLQLSTLSPQPSTAAVQEGLLRESARKGDAFHDVVMMALLRKEWPPAQKLDRARCQHRHAGASSSATTTRGGIVKKPRSDPPVPQRGSNSLPFLHSSFCILLATLRSASGTATTYFGRHPEHD